MNLSRFNGFCHGDEWKAVETAGHSQLGVFTGLKPGVNEWTGDFAILYL